MLAQLEGSSTFFPDVCTCLTTYTASRARSQ